MRIILIVSIALGLTNWTELACSANAPTQKSDTTDVREDWIDGFIDGEVEPRPIPEKCPQPEYPPKALSDRIEGSVRIQVHVDSTGYVDECRITQEQPQGNGFGKAAEQTIKKWEFSPATIDGRPVDSWVSIPIRFKPPK